MTRYLLLTLLAISSAAGAVVIRDDVDDAKYQLSASALPALADMPGEGHGVLIAPQWMVTAAHVVHSHSLAEITVNGEARKVERVFIHPGYKLMPDSMISEALASGDSSKAYEFLASRDDIALVKLASPIADVAPVALYRGDDEVGKTVEIMGKGATGNGSDGEALHASHRTRLRHAFNVVVDGDARWISYAFDPPRSGLALEGITGGGDSGGPVLIDNGGDRQLAGVASWNKYAESKVRPFHAGLYGQVVVSARTSRYVTWIESVMAAESLRSTPLEAAGG